jgi:uncharacterized membrane protein YhdT
MVNRLIGRNNLFLIPFLYGGIGERDEINTPLDKPYFCPFRVFAIGGGGHVPHYSGPRFPFGNMHPAFGIGRIDVSGDGAGICSQSSDTPKTSGQYDGYTLHGKPSFCSFLYRYFSLFMRKFPARFACRFILRYTRERRYALQKIQGATVRKENSFMTDWEKYQQIRREAAYTGLALLVLILFWCWAGFGLADVELEIFGLPLWAVTSSIGVWLFAIVLVKLLLKFVFRDMPLDEEKGAEEHE